MKQNRYTKEQHEFLRKTIPGRTYKETVELFKKEFPETPFTEGRLKGYCNNHKILTGRSGHFEKGHTPFNKGKKGIRYSPETEFKKGNRSHNTLPVGTTVVTTDGYSKTKIAEPNVWEYDHIALYEKAYGKVPEGHCVIFKNKDKTDIWLENLACVSRSELAIINRKGLTSEEPELTEAGILTAKINLAVSAKKREKKRVK